jgi:hypothetical protein
MSSTITADAVSLKELAIQVEPMSGITYVWPDGEHNEYKDSIGATARQGDRKAHFIIGKARAQKEQLGQIRWRYNVFLASTPGNTQSLTSVLDFVAGNNFDQDHPMASLIRHRDGRLVKGSDSAPPEYTEFRLAPFNSLVRGPYARSGLAVVASKDDIESMIRHAVIRAVQKGWLNW